MLLQTAGTQSSGLEGPGVAAGLELPRDIGILWLCQGSPFLLHPFRLTKSLVNRPVPPQPHTDPVAALFHL